jgi:hypothetical protein
MVIHVVTNMQIISSISRSKYFAKNLGFVSTVEKNGKRIPNDKDNFSHRYMNLYRSSIYAQGNVGNIKFYTDHYINDQVMAVYYGEELEEFIFNFDSEFVTKKGIDSFLGKILKELEERYEERIKTKESEKVVEKPRGNSDKIFSNPGDVTYEDLKEYLRKKKEEKEM